MGKKQKIILAFVLVATLIGLASWYISAHNLPILEPKGPIAKQQKDLLVFATLLSLIVVVPVFAMTTYIALKYREGNKKSKYSPNWDGNNWLEAIWWGIPITLILILSVVTWRTSHSLDPFKPLQSTKEPMTIQVVALQWKWLFIYPEQNMATVNYLVMPEDRPIKFEITSDAPMNSFWIPALGGQIYAMSGMSTELNLQADDPGVYEGYSANISGKGFSDMKFLAKATTDAEFEAWLGTVKSSANFLDKNEYENLAKPGTMNEKHYYSVSHNLYDTVVMKYMQPVGQGESLDNNEGDH